jgi:hypothetical protein
MKISYITIIIYLLFLTSRIVAGNFDFYTPAVKHVTIHEGKYAEGHHPYNHMASIEWFDGKFHCVWGGHAATHKEGAPGQINLWSSTEDFNLWPAPLKLAHCGSHALPLDPDSVQWQPNLLNFRNKELWCVWSFNSRNPELDGLWLSRLRQGSAEWQHQRIQRRQQINGLSCSIFASQNPVLLKSGRVLAPVTLNYRDPKHDTGKGHAQAVTVRRWNACFYSDDDGKSWQCSPPLSAIDEPDAQWEPFFYEQSDGQIRYYARNFTRAINPISWRYTTVGTGAKKKEPILFPSDPVFSYMETANCRPQVFKLPCNRFCLLQQDAWVNHRDYRTRLNVALHFSRSGADDFVAATPVSRHNVISAYPQGVAHNGAIYLAYTYGEGDTPRGIEGAMISPLPSKDKRYIWPRSKERVIIKERLTADGKKEIYNFKPGQRTELPFVKQSGDKKVMRFGGGASAGVEIDRPDFADGQCLTVQFNAKILRIQDRGMLILCSFGDQRPIRIGIPANRPEKLYAYTRNQWQPVCDFVTEKWHNVKLTFRPETFFVAVDDAEPVEFSNPLINPNPRLYLGDGFESEHHASNAGSEFLIDLESVQSQIHGRHYIANAAELKARIETQLHTSNPDYIVYVPKAEQNLSDTGNEHFLVFDGPDDSLMAIWTQSSVENFSADTPPDQHISFAHSTDNGITWSEPRIIAGPKKAGDGHMASWAYPLVSKKGRIYVLYSQSIGIHDSFIHHTAWIHGRYSDDKGATWSQPQQVPVARSINDNPDPSMPPNMLVWQKPLRLARDGKYLAGFTRWSSFAARPPVPERGLGSADSRVEFMRFENIDENPEPRDIKISWFMSNQQALAVPFPGHPENSVCQEPSIVKLPDQRLFCVMRTHAGSPYWTISSDQGETWSQPQPLLVKDGGDPLLHPVSPCPIYDIGGNEAGSGRYVLFIHGHDNRSYTGYRPKPSVTGWNRRPVQLLAGRFQPGAQQPVWFDEPQFFMDHDNTSLGKPGTSGRMDLSLYASFTVRNGEAVLWYPERKFFLLGRIITKKEFK